MLVEQRHVTTINLQDGKARDFVVFRDPRGCKVSCATRDEVLNLLLSYQDFQRFCQTLAQPGGAGPVQGPRPSANGDHPAAAAEKACGSIRVEHRHVTTVALHPSKSRDFTLGKDDRGCKVISVSQEEVVTLLLSPCDFQKLRQQVGQWEWRDVRRDSSTAITATPPLAAPVETCEVAVPAEPVAAVATYPWGGLDWLGFN